jgi:flagellar hook assembly protein FlgD
MTIEGIVDQNLIQKYVDLTRELGSTDAEGFDPNMFLKILMVQLQNQSPFDTVDSSEILNQQATLTQVEQSTRQTQTMKEMNDSITVSLGQIKGSLAQINSSLNMLINK